jgi:hypothetical protein
MGAGFPQKGGGVGLATYAVLILVGVHKHKPRLEFATSIDQVCRLCKHRNSTTPASHAGYDAQS